jgi:GMP synthase (glutamine-hydrolysing)
MTASPGHGKRPVLLVVHQAHSNPGRVGGILRARGHPLDRRCPLHGDPLPADLSGYAGVVVFGGPMSANDDHLDGIRAELGLLERAMKAEVPTFGICLGGQMMARVLGARVARPPTEHVEVGYYTVRGTEDGRRLGLFDGPMGVYQWHTEGFDLPAGARLLARGETYPNQAFAAGRRAFGIQFHPEVTHEMMERWMRAAGHMMTWPGATGPAAHRAGRMRHDAALGQWLAHFLDHWLSPQGAG